MDRQVFDLAHAAHPNDPTASSKPDGCVVVVHGENMFVYGGSAADRLWKFDVPSSSWTEIVTHGTVPPARVHHAAVAYNGFMLMTGGELVDGPGAYGYADYLSYYELDLSTFEWLAVETFGSIPGNRAHHSMVPVNDVIVLFGGKPSDGKLLTTSGMVEAKRTGFYDIFVLHVLSRTWRRIEMFDPASPMLWGQSAVVFRDTYLLFFGGFDVGTNAEADSHPFLHNNDLIEAPPAAALTDVVHILDYVTMTWKKCSPGQINAAPIPRAMHCAFCIGASMYVFGGFSLDRAGRGVNANDCWRWDIASGDWHRVEFCAPAFPTRKLIAGAFGDNLIVIPRMNYLFFLNTGVAGSGWQRVPCTASSRVVAYGGLGAAVVSGVAGHYGHDNDGRKVWMFEQSPPEGSLQGTSPRRKSSSPSTHRRVVTPSSAAIPNGNPSAGPRNVRSPTRGQSHHDNRAESEELAALRKEVAALRDRVYAEPRVDSPAHLPRTSPAVVQVRTHPESRGLHKWLNPEGSMGSPARGATSPTPAPTSSNKRNATSPATRQTKAPVGAEPAAAVRSPVTPPRAKYTGERIPLPAREAFRERQMDFTVADASAEVAAAPPPPQPPLHLNPNPAYDVARAAAASASPIRMHASLAGARTLLSKKASLQQSRREQLATLKRRITELRSAPGNSDVDRALLEALDTEAKKVEAALAAAEQRSRSSSPVTDAEVMAHIAESYVPNSSRHQQTGGAVAARASTNGGRQTLMQRMRGKEVPHTNTPSRTRLARDATPRRQVRLGGDSDELFVEPSFSVRSAPSPVAPTTAVPADYEASAHTPFTLGAMAKGVPTSVAPEAPWRAAPQMARPVGRSSGFVVHRAPSTALTDTLVQARAEQFSESMENTSRPVTPLSEYWDELDRALDHQSNAGSYTKAFAARQQRHRPSWQ